MPFKARLKSGEERKRRKPSYRVVNASEYNKSLKNRGKISLYFPSGDLRRQFINASPYMSGVSGRSASYQPSYIQLIYTFYRLFGWGMRQITGYMEDYWERLQLDIPVPSFGHLSDLFSQQKVDIKQRCERLAKQLASGQPVNLIIDSTGLSFGRASQWYEVKYGKKASRVPWRKAHLAMDELMNIHKLVITDTEASDHEAMDRVVPTDITVDRRWCMDTPSGSMLLT